MKLLRAFFLSTIVLFLLVSFGVTKQEYAKKEGKTCTFCHPAGKFKELTEAGKYYKEHNNSLEGYKASAGSK
ncbi:MAG: hypothetical protein ACE145_05665 [Terriglobia bacterium]